MVSEKRRQNERRAHDGVAALGGKGIRFSGHMAAQAFAVATRSGNMARCRQSIHSIFLGAAVPEPIFSHRMVTLKTGRAFVTQGLCVADEGALVAAAVQKTLLRKPRRGVHFISDNAAPRGEEKVDRQDMDSQKMDSQKMDTQNNDRLPA